MAVAAILMSLGLLFRWACWVFATGQAYFLLSEKAYYNNHLYLFVLVCILLSFTQADEFLSVKKQSKPILNVPRWQQFILSLQILIVYFYGGIAKLTHSWLFDQEPVRTLVDSLPAGYLLSPVLKTPFGIGFLNYGGLALDLLAPFFLLYRPIRKWAVVPFVLFHLTNSTLFDDIGVFPFVMLATMFLFFEEKELPFLSKQETVPKSGKITPAAQPVQGASVTPAGIRYAILAFFLFQLLFPFRGFFLPNSLDYTTIGNRFSWRMKVDTRSPEKIEYIVTNQDTGVKNIVNIQKLINNHQMMLLYVDPRASAQFARFVLQEMSRKSPEVSMYSIRANIQFTYNGKTGLIFVDPETDLSRATYNVFEPIPWLKTY